MDGSEQHTGDLDEKLVGQQGQATNEGGNEYSTESDLASTEPAISPRRGLTSEQVEAKLWTRRGALIALGWGLFTAAAAKVGDMMPDTGSEESLSGAVTKESIRQKIHKLNQHLSAATNDLETPYLIKGLEKDKYLQDTLGITLRFKIKKYLGLDDAATLKICKMSTEDGRIIISFIEENERKTVASVTISGNEVEIWADRSDYMGNFDSNKQNADCEQVLVFKLNPTSKEYELVRRKHQFTDDVVVDVNLESGTGEICKAIGMHANSDIVGSNITPFTFDKEGGRVLRIKEDRNPNSRDFAVPHNDIKVLTSLKP